MSRSKGADKTDLREFPTCWRSYEFKHKPPERITGKTTNPDNLIFQQLVSIESKTSFGRIFNQKLISTHILKKDL